MRGKPFNPLEGQGFGGVGAGVPPRKPGGDPSHSLEIRSQESRCTTEIKSRGRSNEESKEDITDEDDNKSGLKTTTQSCSEM